MEEIGKGLSGYLSRVCGGDPLIKLVLEKILIFVPRMRG